MHSKTTHVSLYFQESIFRLVSNMAVVAMYVCDTFSYRIHTFASVSLNLLFLAFNAMILFSSHYICYCTRVFGGQQILHYSQTSAVLLKTIGTQQNYTPTESVVKFSRLSYLLG